MTHVHRQDSKYSILGTWTCNFHVVALVSCFSWRSKSHWVEMFLNKAVHTSENPIHHRSIWLWMCSGFIDSASVVKAAEETSPNQKWDQVRIFIKTFPTLKELFGIRIPVHAHYRNSSFLHAQGWHFPELSQIRMWGCGLNSLLGQFEGLRSHADRCDAVNFSGFRAG